jgi:hypothetical protein
VFLRFDAVRSGNDLPDLNAGLFGVFAVLCGVLSYHYACMSVKNAQFRLMRLIVQLSWDLRYIYIYATHMHTSFPKLPPTAATFM